MQFFDNDLNKYLFFDEFFPSRLLELVCSSHTENKKRKQFLEQNHTLAVKSMRLPYHILSVPNISLQWLCLKVSFLNLFYYPVVRLWYALMYHKCHFRHVLKILSPFKRCDNVPQLIYAWKKSERDTQNNLLVAFKRKKRERIIFYRLGEKIFYRLLAWVPTFNSIPIPITSTPVRAMSSVSMRHSDLI